MTRIGQRLTSAAFDIDWAAKHVEQTIAKLLAQTPDGYPTGGQGTGAGGVANPTASAAATGAKAREQHARLDVLTLQLYGLVGQIVDVIRTTHDPGTDTTADASRARCDGGMGDWADPSCERLAVVKRRLNGVEHQLCYGCDKRRQRATAVAG